ncbi:MAG: hypothetical protein Q9161_004176 [Pseudevernia consocians]
MDPSNNSTNLTAPTPPPGFSTRLKFNPSVQLKPLEVYICAIELMSLIANIPWIYNLPLTMEMTGSDASTEALLHPFPPFSDSRLQVRYAVTGLLDVGVAIAQKSQFYQLDAALFVGDDEVGWLEFRPKPKRDGISNGSVRRLGSGAAVNDSVTVTVTGDGGKITDEDDRNFVLTFSYDGVRIKAQDIFTVLLDAFAIAAEHNNTDADASIPAARSASGDMVLSTWTVGEAGDAEMTWARLKRALIVIWELLIVGQKGQKPRFEGLMFGLEYKGMAIGAGRMLRFAEDGDGDAGSAFER